MVAKDGAEPEPAPMTATATVAERLAAVRADVARACERAGRDPAEVTIVGVTKTQPLAAVREALDATLADLGENRAQELVRKAAEAAAAGLTPIMSSAPTLRSAAK